MGIKAITKKILKKIPGIGTVVFNIYKYLKKLNFPGSQEYWEKRYYNKGNSGKGSYGKFAQFKAEVINSFIKENKIKSVIELGCGDGNQLSLLNISKYIGLDISPTAIKICMGKFKMDKTKSFFLYNPFYFKDNHQIFQAQLTLSLDVIYHLIEDHIFEKYMKDLFSFADRFVIIYSSNIDNSKDSFSPHCKNRQFKKWIVQNIRNWQFIKKIKNKYPDESPSDFFIFEKGII